jgi:hypothetical protein
MLDTGDVRIAKFKAKSAKPQSKIQKNIQGLKRILFLPPRSRRALRKEFFRHR